MVLFLAASKKEQIYARRANNDVSKSLLHPEEAYDPGEGIMMNLVQSNGDQMNALTSFNLGSAIRMSLDFKRLEDKLREAYQIYLEIIQKLYLPKSKSFRAQWQTRVG